MKTNHSNAVGARIAIGTLFILTSAFLLCAIPFTGLHAAKQPSETRGVHKVAIGTLPSTGPIPPTGSVGPAPGGPSSSWQQGMPPN
ncbi:MAG TPA: hypothetical protein VMO75_02525, partial [Chthoniobacterales bacterium]|nr:hypothetical protein [Chthoniobacterales bacterium]